MEDACDCEDSSQEGMESEGERDIIFWVRWRSEQSVFQSNECEGCWDVEDIQRFERKGTVSMASGNVMANLAFIHKPSQSASQT